MIELIKQLKGFISGLLGRKKIVIPKSEIQGPAAPMPSARPPAQYAFGKRSERNMIGLYPNYVKLLRHALARGVMDFAVIDGVRTLEYQKDLYAQGRTKPGKIVTWTLNSKHLVQPDGYGHAFDIVPYPVDWDDEERFIQLNDLIMSSAKMLDIPIDWGYDLWGTDMPHYQSKGV